MPQKFAYDGDGKRVKSVTGSETILFIGAHYEVKGSEITKYYFAGTTRVAMRKYTVPVNMAVEYFVGDHLGSTSMTLDSNGAKVSEMRYKPWGEVRYSWKASQTTTPAYKLPLYTFTGHFSYMDDPTTSGVTEGFGLMFYQSRFYDPSLGRFTSPDSIIPPGVQGLDRYGYVNNNPIRYNDPTGHMCSDPEDPDPTCDGEITRSESRGDETPEKMREYQKPKRPGLTEDLLDKINDLTGGDQTLVDAWQQLYQTNSGYQYAMYIVKNNIAVRWGTPGLYSAESHAYCHQGSCWIEIAAILNPNTTMLSGDEALLEVTLTLGHEAYHHAYGHPGYPNGPIIDSQAEEFLAFANETQIRIEIRGAPDYNFEGYNLVGTGSRHNLFDWVTTYAPTYSSLPSY